MRPCSAPACIVVFVVADCCIYFVANGVVVFLAPLNFLPQCRHLDLIFEPSLIEAFSFMIGCDQSLNMQ